MYNSQQRTPGIGRYRSKPRFTRRPGGRFGGKRGLDPSMFIKKAVGAEHVQTEEPTTTVRFDDYQMVDALKQNIATHGYKNPTAIQEQAIPHILQGRDLIGVANTGTGKTAAFLTSLINKVYQDKSQRVLIVAPTRELALQIKDEFAIFARGMGIGVVAAFGGVSIRQQIVGLQRKPHFVIGTPGRLKDLINRRVLDLSNFHNIVLDEVDRMVDIGFLKDIQYLISFLPRERQSLFFSATIDARTKQVLNGFVSDPITVSVKQQATADNIEQNIVQMVPGRAKIDMLHELLNKPEFEKVIVFGDTKWSMERLATALVARGVKATAIHGNKSQYQRQRALDAFKQNRIDVLIATDVASRGIDVPDVTHVINYDTPTSYDDYVHRIGRTGRAGKRGYALTFVD